jgi:Flp pilus assembly protein TadD
MRHERVTMRVVDGRAEQTRYVGPEAYEHYLRAKLLLGRGDTASGIRALKQAIALDANSPYLHCELADALLANGKPQAAEPLVRRALALQPDFPDALRLHADLLQRAGRIPAARKAYRRCIARAPGLARCYEHLARLLEQDDRLDAARQLLERLVHVSQGKHGQELLVSICLQQLDLACASSLLHDFVGRTNSPAATLMLARIERARGRPTQAIKLLQATHSGDSPRDHDHASLLELVRAMDQAGDKKALEALVAHLVGRISPASATRLVGLLLELRRDRLAAETASALPATLEVQLLQMRALFRLDQSARAEQILEHVRSSITAPRVTTQLARALLDRNRPQEAIRLLRRVARERPDDTIAVAELARILLRSHEPALAATELRRALARHPKSARLMVALAATLHRLGDWNEAVKLAREAAAAEPENAAAHNAWGYILASRGERLEQAERAIRSALRLEPLEPYIIDSLGWLLRARGRRNQARRALEIAHRLDRHDPEILAHLAQTRADLGHTAVALTMLREAASKCRDSGLKKRWSRLADHLEAARVGTAHGSKGGARNGPSLPQQERTTSQRER